MICSSSNKIFKFVYLSIHLEFQTKINNKNVTMFDFYFLLFFFYCRYEENGVQNQTMA